MIIQIISILVAIIVVIIAGLVIWEDMRDVVEMFLDTMDATLRVSIEEVRMEFDKL